MKKGYKTQLHFVWYGNCFSNINFETQIPPDIYEDIREIQKYYKKNSYFFISHTTRFHKLNTPNNKHNKYNYNKI